MNCLFYEQARQALELAVSCEEEEEGGRSRLRALELYKEACEHALRGIRVDPSELERAIMVSRVKQWMSRAEVLSTQLKLEKIPNRVRWKKQLDLDIVGLDTVKQVLREAMFLPVLQPQLFTGNRQPWRALLLFGPPGTGKTAVARAVAKEGDMCEFLSISPSDIISRYQGESEKHLRSVFALARSKAPKRCVVFIDEIDAIGSSRNLCDNESHRRVLLELLRQMDGNSGKDNVLVIAATNLPHLLDSALRRRFECKIYVPLPSLAERAGLIAKKLGRPDSRMHSLTVQQVMWMAASTEGYSGADLAALCNEVLLQPVRLCLQATRFRKTWDGYLVPSTWGMAMRMMDPGFDATKLKVPAAGLTDVQYVLANTSPRSVGGVGEMDRLIAFNQQFGDNTAVTMGNGKDEKEASRMAVLVEWKQARQREWTMANSAGVAAAVAATVTMMMMTTTNNH
ncbi:hypothetical protein BASA81_007379 [Batrachochytrium salamandrivorans]|nr:hypothetical protein BASA81_007379 [Batrachochytrium salamandrivorans]